MFNFFKDIVNNLNNNKTKFSFFEDLLFFIFCSFDLRLQTK